MGSVSHNLKAESILSTSCASLLHWVFHRAIGTSVVGGRRDIYHSHNIYKAITMWHKPKANIRP